MNFTTIYHYYFRRHTEKIFHYKILISDNIEIFLIELKRDTSIEI